jgi:inosose dehydratase
MVGGLEFAPEARPGGLDAAPEARPGGFDAARDARPGGFDGVPSPARRPRFGGFVGTRLTAMASGSILPADWSALISWSAPRDAMSLRSERVRTTPDERARRLAGAPISWGVCEVPGWGRQLPPDRVLAEMASLGLTATELGPLGYLPSDPHALRAQLDAHGLSLVGGFVPLVLHERDLGDARRAAADTARMLAAAGADVFVCALVMDAGWSAPASLDERQFASVVEHIPVIEDLVSEHGLTFALHPHAGTLVESAADVERLLAATDVGWCLDTGHLVIGGCDPVAFVADHGERVVHVHLKDVDAGVAARYGTGELTLVGATQAGLFRPLGQGDARISEVLAQLDAHGYEQWLVLEQDAALTGEEPPVGSGPVLDVRASIDFLMNTAPRRERVA